MNRFNVISSSLDGIKLLQLAPISDPRGSFTRLFCAQDLAEIGLEANISQANISHTKNRGSVRGLHYQAAPDSEDKLVTCIRGEVLDIAVDLRPDSKTFLDFHCETLSPDAGHSLFIPKGFAHGFQTLKDESELLYLHSKPYVATTERGVRVDDPAIGISLPLPITQQSERDKNFTLIGGGFRGVEE